MAVFDDLNTVIGAIDKLSKEGLPIKIEHEIESGTLWNFMLGLGAVALVLVLLLGVKDTILKRL